MSSNHPGSRTFGFIGVTASQSSINRVFPRWAEVLELGPVTFEPVDLPVGAGMEAYRRVVDRIAADPWHVGALVTTHKVRLLEATRDRFASLDAHAGLLNEISCIVKRDGRLHGAAMDPITAGAALHSFLPSDHFAATDAHVLCLGAGGAGLAITVNLLTRAVVERPRRIILVDPERARLDECARVLGDLGVVDAVTLAESGDAGRNDVLVAGLPPGSLVVNATGLGKDRVGSPLTDRAVFPARGLVWELNYRGDLGFLRQARIQQEERGLTVEDGWTYFLHGWSAVVAETFDVPIDERMLKRLGEVAAEVRE